MSRAPTLTPELAAEVQRLRAADLCDRDIADALGLPFHSARRIRREVAGPGRPPRAAAGHELRLRVTAPVFAGLEALATARGATIAEVVRSLLEVA